VINQKKNIMSELSWIEIIYWGATIIGGTLFILRTILLLVGGGLDTHELDHPMETDLLIGQDAHIDTHSTETHPDSDFSFRLLSMQGLTAFFMMFGLVGLALVKANLATPLTILGGGAAGLFAVWLISLLFAQMKRLQSSGTIDIHNAVGQSGSVYLPIPAKGTGQVQVTVQGALKIMDAVSQNGQTIKTGEAIQVTGVLDSKTLIVESK
jgi:membrane protein implicated in regulation of membrane protease activity